MIIAFGIMLAPLVVEEMDRRLIAVAVFVEVVIAAVFAAIALVVEATV